MATMQRYYAAVMSYGVIRKVVDMPDAVYYKYKSNTNSTVPVSVPFVDKVVIVGMSGITAVALWPMNAYRDLLRLESYVRCFSRSQQELLGIGARPKQNVLDFLFD